MDWRECQKNSFVKEVKRDQNLINSLVKASANKVYSQGLLELDDFTSSSKITLLYDALRELLEALAIFYGYKIYNHECYTAFLKEIMGMSNEASMFDGLRKIRNGINYYGRQISAEESKKIIADLKLLISKFKH